MKKKTLAKKEKVEEDKTLEDFENLEKENLMMRDMINLKDEGYFRQQTLAYLERIAKALEQPNSDDDLSEGEEDEED